MRANPQVLTVTLNPAIDMELRVGELRRGAIARAEGVERIAGGKGINVSRELARLGLKSIAAFVAGGADGAVFMELLNKERFELHPIPIKGAVRTNVTAGPAGKGYIFKINQPGPVISSKETEKILREIGRLARGREWVVLSGSLPPGMPVDTYARIVHAAHGKESMVAIDCEGEPLLHALEEWPELVRINRRELSNMLGRPLKTKASVLKAIDELQRRGALYVAVTDGPRAAYAIGERDTIFQSIPPIRSATHVFGAGDAMLAAMIARMIRGDAFGEAFTAAIAHVSKNLGIRTAGARVPCGSVRRGVRWL